MAVNRKHTANTGLLLTKQYFSPSLFSQHSKALRIQQCECIWRETMQDKAGATPEKIESPE